MKQYLSAGVYTQVYDRSFLQSAPPSGPAAIFVGPFSKGRALIPMTIKDSKDLINKVGQPNGQLYTPYAAYQYSKQKGDFYVQRILWNQGWETDAYAIYAKTDGDTSGSILSVLISTLPGDGLNITDITDSTKSGTNWSDLKMKATSTVGDVTRTNDYTVSVANILKVDQVFKTNPTQNKPFYVFANVSDYSSSTDLTEFDTISVVKIDDFYSSSAGFSSARTPMVYNDMGEQLFYFNHLSDGTYTNKDIKIAIENVNTSSTLQDTQFDVIVRNYSDTYKYPEVLQTFYQVNLNPTSKRYISKIIGDGYVTYNTSSKKITINGDYANKSNYIRVVVSDIVKNMDINRLGNINQIGRIPFIGGSATDIVKEEYSTVYTSSTQIVDGITHYGYNTSLNTVKYLSNPVGDEGLTTSVTNIIDTVGGDFIIPFYGGFDGRNPSIGFNTDTNTLNGFDFTNTSSNGYLQYEKAIKLLKNVQQFDIDMISVPGLNLEDTGKATLIQTILDDVADYRGDIFVPVDAGNHGNVNPDTVLTTTQDFDNSYGACYYPEVKIECEFTKKLPVIPAATYIPAVVAYTANVSQPHYAPAGINRGVLNVIQPVVKLNKEDRDNLYKNRINPIVSFVNDGTVVWGQKTLQKAESALDRVNVRILINGIVKWINNYGKRVLFENSTTNLRTVFSTGVQRRMNAIVAANGLYAYKFVMDETNNTAQVVDRNQLIGQLYIKPTKTAQFIIIPINVLRSDAEL